MPCKKCKGYRKAVLNRPLNTQEVNLLKYYTDPESDTYLNKAGSYRKAYGKAKTKESRYIYNWVTKKFRSARIMKALKEMFTEDEEYKDLIRKGMKERLKDPLTRHFQPSAEFVTKVLGEFAPEKSVNLNLDSTDREAFYNRVTERIEALTEGDKVEPLPQATPVKKVLPESF